ncbi:hypothetical protein [Ktedonobacter racemifer]|uniref:Uncharacterized protein n=1 Tax=Ktedonobacter racemifer DSM 44963 TaxID=485913 RepID=D6TH14_KTERA|nr:hypothetical protein [Ktedonobacter racemifer]EFH88943.1 hypothetical protein Krac_10459 [Ktedonobacter racemifer DSM 44963]
MTTNPEKKRQNLEQLALARFKEVALEKNMKVYGSQGKGNRIAISGRSYFQFGDLRVETPQRTLIVEAESAGGATNQVKYWYCLGKGHITRPIHLMHIFAQNSENDYQSHLDLWDFLAQKMASDLGNMFTAKRYTYRNTSDLESIVKEFQGLLN